MPQIVLEHVTKRFGGTAAVQDLNMVIEDREFVTLLGPSGCGKTTTLRMIAGLETPTEGRITIDGAVVFDAEKGVNVAPGRRGIGFMFQNNALWPHMTVYQNIAFGLENLRWPKEEIRGRVDEMLALLKIEQLEKRYPNELSGGQQQRVAIARTLAPRPKVLFMDEPLSSLDAKLRLEMRAELKRLHADTNSTFVYVTHDQQEAMTLATRICLMKDGILQQYDTPYALYNDPANMFAADFTGDPAINFVTASARKLDDTHAEVKALGSSMIFESGKPLGEAGSGEDNAVLGIRPEFLRLKNGAHKSKVYATLPAGTQTTVKLEAPDGTMLTSVEFGIADYDLNAEVNYEIAGNGIILFDKKSGNNIGKGSVRL